MHAVLDIGNSSYKLGFFRPGDKEPEAQASLHAPEAVCDALKRHGFGQLLVSSVSPKRLKRLEAMWAKHSFFSSAAYHLLTHETKIPLHLHYAPQDLGTDRIATAVGSRVLFPKKNCLIIDFGTCLTYNFVDEKDNYRGGGITLGVHMRYQALSTFTEALPACSPDFDARITTCPGDSTPRLSTTSTTESIAHGVLWGLLSELQGMIAHYKARYDQIFVIFCGGDSSFFSDKIKEPIVCKPDLGLVGLHRILLGLQN